MQVQLLSLLSHGLLFDFFLSCMTVISCVLLIVGVYNRPRLLFVHKTFILALMGLATAYLFRSLVWLYEDPVYYKASYIGFLSIPLFLCLFLEAATEKSAALWFKLYSLFHGGGILVSLFFLEDIEKASWLIHLFIYHSISLCYLTYLSYQAKRSAHNRIEASIFQAISTCLALGVLFGLLDWAARFGWGNLRLSTLPSLLLIYFLTSIFFSQGSFSFKKHIQKLVVFLIFPLSSYLLLISFAPNLNGILLTKVVILSYFSFVPVSILCHVFGLSLDTDGKALLRKIQILPNRSPEEFVSSLESWSEISRVHLMTNTFTQQYELQLLFSNQEADLVYSYDEVKRSLLNCPPQDPMLSKYEALDFVFRYTDCDFLCLLKDSQSILLAKYSNLMDLSYYREIMAMLARDLSQVIRLSEMQKRGLS